MIESTRLQVNARAENRHVSCGTEKIGCDHYRLTLLSHSHETKRNDMRGTEGGAYSRENGKSQLATERKCPSGPQSHAPHNYSNEMRVVPSPLLFLLFLIPLLPSTLAEPHCFERITKSLDHRPPSHIDDCDYALFEIRMAMGDTLYQFQHTATQPNPQYTEIRVPQVTVISEFGGPLGCGVIMDLDPDVDFAIASGLDVDNAVSQILNVCVKDPGGPKAGWMVVDWQRLLNVSIVGLPPGPPGPGKVIVGTQMA